MFGNEQHKHPIKDCLSQAAGVCLSFRTTNKVRDQMGISDSLTGSVGRGTGKLLNILQIWCEDSWDKYCLGWNSLDATSSLVKCCFTSFPFSSHPSFVTLEALGCCHLDIVDSLHREYVIPTVGNICLLSLAPKSFSAGLGAPRN